MGFDDRAQSTARELDEDGNPHKATKALGDKQSRSIFRKDDPTGPRDYELWNLTYDNVADANAALDIRNDLLAEFPGQLRTIGGWWIEYDKPFARQVGTEFVYEDVTRDVTIQDPDWDEALWPQIANPAYQPDPDLNDFDPDEFINDPSFDPPTVVIQVTTNEITGTSGQPTFPLHVRILEFVPDIDELGTRPTEMTDVNKGQGHPNRDFS